LGKKISDRAERETRVACGISRSFNEGLAVRMLSPAWTASGPGLPEKCPNSRELSYAPPDAINSPETTSVTEAARLFVHSYHTNPPSGRSNLHLDGPIANYRSVRRPLLRASLSLGGARATNGAHHVASACHEADPKRTGLLAQVESFTLHGQPLLVEDNCISVQRPFPAANIVRGLIKSLST